MKKMIAFLLLVACKKTITYEYVGIPDGTEQTVRCGQMGPTWLCVHGTKSYQCAQSTETKDDIVLNTRVCAAYVPMLPNGQAPVEKP